jgi:Zn-dependent protease
MFGKPITLFRVFGFAIRLDWSWFIIAVLIAWSLAEGVFDQHYDIEEATTRWIMGAIGAIGLFISVVLHELGHATVARKFGVPIHGITLFIFGGVAEMQEEPKSAKAEFWVAVAGPAVSILLAALLTGIARFPLPASVEGVVGWLGLINAVLVAFNILPAFPLDGGRVLRSIVWRFKGDFKAATRVPAKVGAGFGILLMLLGVLFFITGNLIGGIWWIVLGLFLRGIAKNAYRQVLWRDILSDIHVRRLMNDKPHTVGPDASVRELVDDYLYRLPFKMFPVVDDSDKLVGAVSVDDVKQLPRERWEEQTVRDVLHAPSDDNTIGPDEPAVNALQQIGPRSPSRLLVVDDNGRLAGVIALRDLWNYLSRRIEFEEQTGS